MAPPTRSTIWDYFSAVDVDSAKCNICAKVYSRKGRTTISLKNHLHAVHPEKYKLFKKVEENKVPVKNTTLTPLQESKKQLTLTESLQRSQKWDKNDPKAKEIDKLVGEMIAVQDCRSISSRELVSED